jgi:hypothetical protein
MHSKALHVLHPVGNLYKSKIRDKIASFSLLEIAKKKEARMKSPPESLFVEQNFTLLDYNETTAGRTPVPEDPMIGHPVEYWIVVHSQTIRSYVLRL